MKMTIKITLSNGITKQKNDRFLDLINPDHYKDHCGVASVSRIDELQVPIAKEPIKETVVCKRDL